MHNGTSCGAKAVFLSIVAVTMVFSSGIQAQTRCPSPLASHFYDGSDVPETYSGGAWEVFTEVTQNATWSSDGEYLYLDAYDGGSVGFYRIEESLAQAKSYEIRGRVRIDRADPVAWIPQIFMGLGISDGTKVVLLWTGGDPDLGRVAVNFYAEIKYSDELIVDYYTMNEFRIFVDKTDVDPSRHFAFVYVEDVLVIPPIPYSELNDTTDYPEIGGKPQVIAFGAAASDTEWDYVNYEVCEEGILDAPPPMEALVENMKQEVIELDVNQGVKNALNNHLDQVIEIVSPSKKGEKLLHISRDVFQDKFSRVLVENAASKRLETKLDFARNTVSPELFRDVGFHNKLETICSPAKVPVVAPGTTEARLSLQMRVNTSIVKEIDNPALLARTSVVDRKTGDVIKSDSYLVDIDVGKDEYILDFSWLGEKSDWSIVTLGNTYFLDATIDYVQLDNAGNISRYLDQVSRTIYIETVSEDWYQQPIAVLNSLEWNHAAIAECRMAELGPRDLEAELEIAQITDTPINKQMIHFSHRGVVRGIRGLNTAIPIDLPTGINPSPENYAREFLNRNRIIFRLNNPDVELVINKVRSDSQGRQYIWFDQFMDGIPVFGNGMLVQLTPNDEFAGLRGNVLPSGSTGTVPILTEQEAISIAESDVLPDNPIDPVYGILGVYDPEVFEDEAFDPALVWQVKVFVEGPHIWVYFIDAIDGSIIFRYDDIKGNYPFEVYCAYNTSEIPGTLVYRNDPYYFMGNFPDTSDDIFLGSWLTSRYFINRHGRSSWDDGITPFPLPQIAISDFGSSAAPYDAQARFYPNYLVTAFGDNAACTDIVGHELTHGISHFEGFTIGSGQLGALNEAFSDVFGELIEEYNYGNADWEQGSGVSCFPIRRLYDPEDPIVCPVGYDNMCLASSANWSNYGLYGTTAHDNMGIGTLAGWLMGRDTSEGAATFAGLSVYGIGEYATSKIWYRVLRNELTVNSTFQDFRSAITTAAVQLFYTIPFYVYNAVNAVKAVGIWTEDSIQDFDTDDPVAVAKFAVDRESRRYIFYKYQPAYYPYPFIYYRYRTCSLSSSCSWTSSTGISVGSEPASVVYNGQLWVFFRYVNNRIYYNKLLDNGEWETNNEIPNYPATDDSISVVVFQDYLFLFYKEVGEGQERIWYLAYNPATGWTAPTQTPAFSEAGPAAASLDGGLYFFYQRDVGPDNLKYRATAIPPFWSSERSIGTTDGTPGAAVFKGRIHVSARTSDNSIYYRSYCPTGGSCTYRIGEWTKWVLQHGSARDFITLYPGTDGNLYMFFRGVDTNIVYWRNKSSE